MNVEEYKKIISDAVGDEKEAYEFYSGVAEKVNDRNLKDIFRELADEEKKHEKSLSGFISDMRLMHFHEKKDYKISQSIEKPHLSLNMKPSDAIALAMKKEEEAMNMYTELANCSNNQQQKEVFQALANMEKGHKVKLEDMYTNMAFPEAW